LGAQIELICAAVTKRPAAVTLHLGGSGAPPGSQVRAAAVPAEDDRPGSRRRHRAGSPDGANSDLMPERENLDLAGLVTAPEQDREMEETTEDEVEEGPQHK
jgi:hypothetical protein